jgi:phosphatidylserine/phosphatidylglycerophosphate/cardiolipin synthase-like enzyme
MRDAGIAVIFKPRIHQKLAIIDQKTVWYGSINLLSFGTSEESMMRIVSGNIALELADSLSIECMPSLEEEILNPSENKLDKTKHNT